MSARDGERQWSLSSRRISFSYKGVLAYLNGVSAEVPSSGLTISSAEGTYDLRNGELLLRGDVMASSAAFSLSLPDVKLSGDEVVSDGEVVVRAEGFRLTGRGLRAHNDEVRLLSEVRADFY